MEPGAAVRVAMSKWGDRPHWSYEATYLGSDEHGDWLGVPAGTPMRRPGADYVPPVDQVVLAPARLGGPHHTDGRRATSSPATELDPELGWVATFHAEGGVVEVYVDIATPPVWRGSVLHAVDLDLDVVRVPNGRVWVDDEDEFADHRVRLGYPDEVVSHAAISCEFVTGALRDRVPPYDGATAAGWLRQVPRG